MYHLETAKIVAIRDMFGFQMGKKAGIALEFEDGRRGMYKPCGSGTNTILIFFFIRFIVIYRERMARK